MRRGCCSFVFAMACFAPETVLAQPEAKKTGLERIFGDWQERQHLFKTARYIISGTTEFKDKDLPPGNRVRPNRTVLLLDLERKRWRLESSQEVKNYQGGRGLAFTSRLGTTAFDGTARQAYYHRQANGLEEDGPDLSIEKGQKSHGPAFTAEVLPVFLAHGIVPSVHHELRGDDLPTNYDLENFEIRGQVSFKGGPSTVVRTLAIPAMEPSFDEFWISVAQKSAVQRYISFSGTNPFVRCDVDWKKTPQGWWPDRWTVTYTLAGKVWRVHRLTIESFEANPSVADSDFKLEAKPGMKVLVADSPPPGPGLNPDLPATRTYLISPSGSWQEVGARGYTTLDGSVLPPERGTPWIWWAIVGTVIVAALAFYTWRWRKKVASG